MESSGSRNTARKEYILKVTIHSCENLKSNVLLQPSLCLHVIDGKSGEYIKKSDRNRAVVSFYENQRNDVDYIMPIMTRPCSILGEKLSMLSWEEELILNEKYDVFIRKDSNIILFFEILDMMPVSVTKHNYESLNHKGMHKLAWAFLKLHGCNGVINVGSKLRLQLYKPYYSQKKNVGHTQSPGNVFNWWLQNARQPLEASLLISVEPLVTFSVEPALRSLLPIQQELGSTSFDKLTGISMECSFDGAKKSDRISEEEKVIWSRKVGEPCKIPVKKTMLLDTVNCCHILKFSSSGRILAAGCGALDSYYLLFYKIPDGNILHKVLAHSELIYDLDWSYDDEHMISASGDYSVKMWNSNSFSLVTIFVHPSFVYSAKFHPKLKNLLASACYDHIVRIWDVTKFQILKELEAHNSTVYSICWSTCGTKLFSADGIGHIKVWKNKGDLENSYQLEKAIEPLGKTKGISINKIILDPKKENLFLFCSDSVARILDLFTGNIISSFESDIHPPKISKGCCSACGNLLFLSNETGNVSVWDRNSYNIIPENVLYDMNNGGISCIEYHPYEHMVALSFWEDHVPVYIFTNKKDNQLEKEDNKMVGYPIKENTTLQKESNASAVAGNNIPEVVQKFLHNYKNIDEMSSSGTSDLFFDKLKLDNHEDECLTAVITSTGKFDVIAIPDNSTCLDSDAFRNSSEESVILNKNSKRSKRRQKLGQMDNHTLILNK